jgi:hypothetical protein
MKPFHKFGRHAAGAKKPTRNDTTPVKHATFSLVIQRMPLKKMENMSRVAKLLQETILGADEPRDLMDTTNKQDAKPRCDCDCDVSKDAVLSARKLRMSVEKNRKSTPSA